MADEILKRMMLQEVGVRASSRLSLGRFACATALLTTIACLLAPCSSNARCTKCAAAIGSARLTTVRRLSLCRPPSDLCAHVPLTLCRRLALRCAITRSSVSPSSRRWWRHSSGWRHSWPACDRRSDRWRPHARRRSTPTRPTDSSRGITWRRPPTRLDTRRHTGRPRSRRCHRALVLVSAERPPVDAADRVSARQPNSSTRAPSPRRMRERNRRHRYQEASDLHEQIDCMIAPAIAIVSLACTCRNLISTPIE